MKSKLINRSKWAKGFSLLLIACTLATAKAHASAWPMRKGHLMLSPSIGYFNASRLWDKNGKASDYPDSGYFKSVGIYLYGEYGASRRVTVVASIPFSINTYSQAGTKSTARGLGDGELGFRYYLLNANYKFYMSVQATAVIPLYVNNASNNLGFQLFGSDVQLLGSGSTKVGAETSLFYSFSAGARQYFAAAGPLQLKSAVTLGLNLDKSNQFSLSSTGIVSQSSNKNFNVNLLENRDFSYLQVSASIGHSFSLNTSAFVNYSQFIIGKNSGIGNNITLSLVQRF